LAKLQAKRGYLVHFLRLLAVHWPARAHPVHGFRATMARGVLMHTEERTRTRTHVQTIRKHYIVPRFLRRFLCKNRYLLCGAVADTPI